MRVKIIGTVTEMPDQALHDAKNRSVIPNLFRNLAVNTISHHARGKTILRLHPYE